ncbi:MAG: UDP-glucose 4-epimerase [Actinomycetota bacterium]|nr:UDP-glucose 4-epimerase [Actinomycetota bacterium]
MRILVTGGAGYIGSVVTAHLVEAGHEVVVLDNLVTGHRDAVAPEATFVEGDIADASVTGPVLADGIEAVMHFAAYSLVGESAEHPEKYYRNNVVGTFGLLEAMREAGTPSLVFSSSAATYGEPEVVPITEDAPTRPTNAYGATKLAMDHMIGFYCAAHGLGAVSLRYFNVAGAFGTRGERHAVETHLIPLVLQVPLGQREAISVFGTDYPTPDGTAIRDYIHVNDLSRAHLLAVAACTPGEHRIYNLGCGDGFSVREVLEVCREVTGEPIPAVEVGRRAGDPARLVASSERIQAELGWLPEFGLPDMVRDAWAFAQYRANDFPDEV